MAMWNPWRGCHRYSEGCKFCYIHKGDAKRGMDTNRIVKTDDFYRPVARKKNGEYKMKPGLVYVCFSTDFLIEETDLWRGECWDMIRERKDCQFLFLTKRIERFMECVPPDWGEGWDNVTVGCTVENQQRADERLRIFSRLPIKHKNIICQPMISAIDLEQYLSGVEYVTCGGESDRFARPMHYDWVLSLREQCIRQNVSFEFRQCGTHFIKDGREYTLQKKDLCSQARKANINFQVKPVIRVYASADCPELARLFYDTVHTVNAADYTPEQLDAWATGEVDPDLWNASFLAHHTVVAEKNGVIVGFGDMDASGYLDRLYVHKDHQHQGIATAICDALETASGAKNFTTHASITARPFFERRGYTVIKEQQVERRGILLTNFVMKKER